MSIKYDDTAFFEYLKLFENARELEKSNKIDDALVIYLYILSKYEPTGSLYYERPAIILEKHNKYDKAIEICNIALNNPKRFNKPTWKAIKQNFTKRKIRLLSKLNKSEANPSN